MPKIQINNLNKIYGKNLQKALKLLEQGYSNAEIRSLTKKVVGVRDVNLDINEGETFVIMGLSGSGKSTLLRCINRLIEPTTGSIVVDNIDIARADTKQLMAIRKGKMAMVFQRFALFPHRSVLENVAFGLEVQNVAEKARKEKAAAALEMVGLKGWENYYPHNMSGGMQQRIGIARALAINPDILLMDEPFSALDPLIRQDMQDELVKLQDRLKKTIIFVTHDLDEALKLGDRIALMKDGEVVQVGGSEDILLSPATEYVARFVENVDRSKALTAATVMRKPGILGFPKDGPLTALRKMQELGTSSLFVSDRSGRLIGVINAEDALIAHKNGEKSLNSITRTNIPTTSPDTPLCDLLETMATTKIPVAVVNEENRILGILVRGSVIAGIAGKGSDLSERK